MSTAKRRSIHLSLAAAAGIVAACAAGCSSVRIVDIDSKPTGATIYVDGEEKGMTRMKVQIPYTKDPTKRVLIQVVAPTFKPAFVYWTYLEIPEDKKVFTLEPR